jgi:metal-responsive CopG/Arc/MetJ family transcriptional regulator
MTTKLKRGRRAAKDKIARASVSLPKTLYETLGLIAEQKKVSVAWVIRDAAEKYVTDQWPLLGGPR